MYYSNSDATKEIRRRHREGNVIFTDHAAMRMRQRNITRSDVYNCIRSGRVVSSSYNNKHNQQVYQVKLETEYNGDINIKVAIPDDCENDVVVTVF